MQTGSDSARAAMTSAPMPPRISRKYGAAARSLFADAKAMLERIVREQPDLLE